MVTGGAGGIGSAICRALLATGHRVISLDRPASGGSVERLEVDLADETSARSAAATVLRDHGRCHVLVHAAADFSRSDLAGLDIATWRRVQAVNVESFLLLSQAFAPRMAEAGFGRIVAIVSDTVWSPPAPDLLPYVSSRARSSASPGRCGPRCLRGRRHLRGTWADPRRCGTAGNARRRVRRQRAPASLAAAART